jgi:aminomethyltransferase
MERERRSADGTRCSAPAGGSFHRAEGAPRRGRRSTTLAGVSTVGEGPLSTRHALHPNVRRSPYFAATERAGATEYMVYNHMYMAVAFAGDPREAYVALRERVCLWDVGAERQTELRGPDAVAFANFLCTRDLRGLAVGQCRFTMLCDDAGTIMSESIVLRPSEHTVWISHGDVDLTLWASALARAGGYHVAVGEPDVAPIQVQGPRSRDLLSALTPDVSELAYYRCVETTIAGQWCVVSRTGWSRELGYEVFPIGSEGAMDLWDALERAGERHGVLVTGPNLNRAIEQAITDTHYYVNSGMNPYEAGAGRLLELASAPFVGAEALSRAAQAPLERHTLGLALDSDPGRLEEFWAISDEEGPAGVVRWAAYSYALDEHLAIALLPRRVGVGDRVTVHAPAGAVGGAVRELPFVT